MPPELRRTERLVERAIAGWPAWSAADVQYGHRSVAGQCRGSEEEEAVSVTPQQRLERIRKYADDLLLRFGTTYVKMGSPRVPNSIDASLPKDWEAHYLLNEMRYFALIVALVEGAKDEREALNRREEIVVRYIEQARTAGRP